MKTAICFSGQPRKSIVELFQSNFNEFLFKPILEHGSTIDFFCHFWSHCESNKRGECFDIRRPEDHKILDDLIHPILMEHIAITELPPAQSMYRSIQLSNDLKMRHELINGFRYDCVIRLRNDFELRAGFPVQILDQLDKIHVREAGNIHINDQFALSSSKNMDTYSQCFDYIKRNEFVEHDHEGILGRYFDTCGLRQKTQLFQEPYFFWF